MKIIKSPHQLQQLLEKERISGKSIGFIPTLGALHAGHLSLVKASNWENDVTVVSIFVNPAQFGPKEDYKKYPRVFAADKKMLQKFDVDYLFCPSAQSMYPPGFTTWVEVGAQQGPLLARGLCGRFRPGHFRGVATVVAKLLNIVGPSQLYLGAKDYQQVVIINQMVRDLNMNVRVRIMPTMRERDGLALSSRNRYLNAQERKRAAMIFQVLRALKAIASKKKVPLASLRQQAIQKLKRSVGTVQYLEIVDPLTLQPLQKYQRKMVVLTACFVGKTRLIDNVIIHAQ